MNLRVLKDEDSEQKIWNPILQCLKLVLVTLKVKEKKRILLEGLFIVTHKHQRIFVYVTTCCHMVTR